MSRALALAANWFGIVCLVGALVTSVALAVSEALEPSAPFWVAAAALVPMGALLVALGLRRSRALTLAYLLVGGLATSLYVFALLSDHASFSASNLFVIALPKIALVVVGGAGAGAVSGIAWTTAGWLVAEASAVGAALAAQSEVKLDTTTLVAYLVLAAVLLFDGHTRRSARRAQPAIHRAARENRALELRHELELRAAAHLHDTALSQLIVLAESTPGPLEPRLSERIGHELNSLVDQDWLLSTTQRGEHRGSAAMQAVAGESTSERSEAWHHSELSVAIDAAQTLGLNVLISGDPNVVSGLKRNVDVALGRALQQCLVNVVRHAGVTEADVTIVAGAGDVTVIVVDDGVGFVQADAAEGEHLGLAHSVRRRIESLGGTVDVWSQPGVGSSVMMSVPWAYAASAHNSSSASSASSAAGKGTSR